MENSSSKEGHFGHIKNVKNVKNLTKIWCWENGA